MRNYAIMKSNETTAKQMSKENKKNNTRVLEVNAVVGGPNNLRSATLRLRRFTTMLYKLTLTPKLTQR